MAKRTYAGRDNTARKVKKGTAGADQTARKIRKAYIGIGGVARPCWSGGEIAYYGAITPLGTARKGTASGTAGEWSVIGGGAGNNLTWYGAVDAYNAQLTRVQPPAYTPTSADYAGGSVGNHAIFAGGGNSNVTSNITSANVVHAYDADLTHSNLTALSQKRDRLRGISSPDYLLIGPGQWSSYVANVDAYDAQLVRHVPSSVSTARCFVGGAAVGAYMIIAGGLLTPGKTNCVDTVDVYDADLTRTTGTVLSSVRVQMGCVSGGTQALFGGGGIANTTTVTNAVDVYDGDLTRVAAPSLSQGRCAPFGGYLGEKAVFVGGNSGSTNMSVAECYDQNLTRTQMSPLSNGRRSGCSCGTDAVTVGDYLLIAGEFSDVESPTAAVESYILN